MRAMHTGTLTSDGRFDGMLNGTAIVPTGASAEVAGMINGALIVEAGATVHVSGMVNGGIVDRGGRVIVSGLITG